MTKLQKLEAAARKWAELSVLHYRQTIAERARGDATSWNDFTASGDYQQLTVDESLARQEVLDAARELIR